MKYFSLYGVCMGRGETPADTSADVPSGQPEKPEKGILDMGNPDHINMLFRYVCDALLDGTVGEIGQPANPINIGLKVQNLLRIHNHSIDYEHPTNAAIIRREVDRVNGTRFRERMFCQYKYLVEHPGVNLKDLDLEKMHGI